MIDIPNNLTKRIIDFSAKDMWLYSFAKWVINHSIWSAFFFLVITYTLGLIGLQFLNLPEGLNAFLHVVWCVGYPLILLIISSYHWNSRDSINGKYKYIRDFKMYVNTLKRDK